MVYTENMGNDERTVRDMPRYRVKEKKDAMGKISVFSCVFPLFSVLYAEGMFVCFSGGSVNIFKFWFALAAGCVAAALCRLTPLKGLNYLLQTVWLLLCTGLITAQYLCLYAHGECFSVFALRESAAYLPGMLTAAADNTMFLLCMAVPAVLQITLQPVLMLHRRSSLGGGWVAAFGWLLLAVILTFTAVTMAFYADEGVSSPRRQIETAYMPLASVETFGVLPQTVLDLKFNVLHIAKEENVRHYIVTEDGRQVELTDEELEAWMKEG